MTTALNSKEYVTQADLNFALQDACQAGDLETARLFIDKAEIASVNRSLKKAGFAGSTECMDLLFERLDRERALDSFDVAIALSWTVASHRAGTKECLEKLVGRSKGEDMSFALCQMIEAINERAVDDLMSLGADPNQSHCYEAEEKTTPMDKAQKIAKSYASSQGELKSKIEAISLSLTASRGHKKENKRKI